MFAGLLTMRERCSVCSHQFMSEAGFFQGAMYVSFFAGVAEFALIAVIAYMFLGPHLGVELALTVAVAVHLLLVPQLFQYSRVIWAHFWRVMERND